MKYTNPTMVAKPLNKPVTHEKYRSEEPPFRDLNSHIENLIGRLWAKGLNLFKIMRYRLVLSLLCLSVFGCNKPCDFETAFSEQEDRYWSIIDPKPYARFFWRDCDDPPGVQGAGRHQVNATGIFCTENEPKINVQILTHPDSLKDGIKMTLVFTDSCHIDSIQPEGILQTHLINSTNYIAEFENEEGKNAVWFKLERP